MATCSLKSLGSVLWRSGAYAGKTLSELWAFGMQRYFPLLIKILDAGPQMMSMLHQRSSQCLNAGILVQRENGDIVGRNAEESLQRGKWSHVPIALILSWPDVT